MGVPIVLADLVAHFSNVQLCGSVWACPVCGARIRERRAGEIESALAVHFARGGGAGFLTMTGRHDLGDRLAPLFGAIADGFRSLNGSRGWREDVVTFGIVGTIRSAEITHGLNGWHPHLHDLVLTKQPLCDASWTALADRIFPRWESSLVRAGYGAPLREYGVTLSAVRSAADVASYTSKLQDGDALRSVGRELTRHDMKQARRHGRTPLSILADFDATGDTTDLRLWHEYEAATKGRRSLTWSRGLKRALAVLDVTDDEIVAEEVGGEVIEVLTQPEWSYVVTRRLRAFLLELAELPERVTLDTVLGVIRTEVEKCE